MHNLWIYLADKARSRSRSDSKSKMILRSSLSVSDKMRFREFSETDSLEIEFPFQQILELQENYHFKTKMGGGINNCTSNENLNSITMIILNDINFFIEKTLKFFIQKHKYDGKLTFTKFKHIFLQVLECPLTTSINIPNQQRNKSRLLLFDQLEDSQYWGTTLNGIPHGFGITKKGLWVQTKQFNEQLIKFFKHQPNNILLNNINDNQMWKFYSGLWANGTPISYGMIDLINRFKHGEMNHTNYTLEIQDGFGIVSHGVAFPAENYVEKQIEYSYGIRSNCSLCGRGFRKDKKGIYEGNFVGNACHGQGKMMFCDGKIYTGNFSSGMSFGPGELIVYGQKIKGIFREGLYCVRIEGEIDENGCGNGIIELENGTYEEGQFENYQLQGWGKRTRGGRVIIGNFLNGILKK